MQEHGELMVSVLALRSSGLGSSPDQRHKYVMFLGETLDSHGTSLHPGV